MDTAVMDHEGGAATDKARPAYKVADLALAELSRLCAMIKENCQTHAGITEGTFYRDEGWYFYEIGKQIERADQTTRLLGFFLYHLHG